MILIGIIAYKNVCFENVLRRSLILILFKGGSSLFDDVLLLFKNAIVYF